MSCSPVKMAERKLTAARAREAGARTLSEAVAARRTVRFWEAEVARLRGRCCVSDPPTTAPGRSDRS